MPGERYTRDKMPNNTTALVHELWQMLHELIDLVDEIKTDFNAHNHGASAANAPTETVAGTSPAKMSF